MQRHLHFWDSTKVPPIQQGSILSRDNHPFKGFPMENSCVESSDVP
jgi:hypothetical protein